MVMGVNDALIDSGYLRPWPSEKVAFEVCAQLAARLQGPDVLPEEGLSKQSALVIAQELKTANDRLLQAGHKADVLALYQVKQAAALELPVRGARIAEAYMAKAAAEGGSLTNVGENTPESAAQAEQLAKLDIHNRGPAEYLVGVGNSQMPTGGVVGKEMGHPKRQQNSPSISNSLTEHSAKAASDRAFLNLFKTPAPPAKVARVNTEADLAALALGKTADEDMSTGDLGGAPGGAPPGAGAAPGGAPPGAGAAPGKIEQLKAMLSALMGKFQQAPSPEGQLATAGLAAHPEGMNVMASILERAKTAEEADEILQQILHHQGQAGQLATPDLIAAIQELLAAHGGGGEGGEGGEVPPGAEAAAAPPPEDKMASLMAELKKIAEGGGGGSLTTVGKNTPESAAKDEQLAKLDQHNRSTKDYLEGQGGTKFPNKGQQFSVQKNDAHENPVKTDTVPSRETTKNASKANGKANGKTNGNAKAAEAELSDEEKEYVTQLRKVAEVYGPLLPALLTQKEKVAHIQQLHARAPSDRASYIQSLAS
jgi:hypothetical protein